MTSSQQIAPWRLGGLPPVEKSHRTVHKTPQNKSVSSASQNPGQDQSGHGFDWCLWNGCLLSPPCTPPILWCPFSGGSKGGRKVRTPPPRASKFFQFHAVFGRIYQNCVFTPPPGRVHAPTWGNPGSVTAFPFPPWTPLSLPCNNPKSSLHNVTLTSFSNEDANTFWQFDGLSLEAWIFALSHTWHSCFKFTLLFVFKEDTINCSDRCWQLLTDVSMSKSSVSLDG